jgi:hypothetical protein
VDLLVGAAGVVIGLAGLILGVVRYRASQPRLRLKVSLAMLDPGSGPAMFVVVHAANVGGHPMKVQSAGLRMSDKRTMVLLNAYPWSERFPAVIERWHDHSTYLPLDELREHLESEARKTGRRIRVTKGFYRDATGREWRCDARGPLLEAKPQTG